MKQKAQRLFTGVLALLMGLLLVFSALPVTAQAANTDYSTTIKLTGRSDNGKFELTSSNFNLLDLKGAAPGDVWTGSVKVVNDTDGDMEIALWSITNNLRRGTDLFQVLDLEISVAGESCYDGPYAVKYCPVTDYYVIRSGGTMYFDIEITFPGNVGNEYQGGKLDSTWTFDARYYEPEGELLDYYVHYLDQRGNKLIPSKLGHGYEGEVIMEYAASIPGYTPDLSVKYTVLRKNKVNEIIFFYTKSDSTIPDDTKKPDEPTKPNDPTNPQKPSDTGGSKPSDPGSDVIQTGVDLMKSNTALASFLLILLLGMFAAIVIYFRIRSIKKQQQREAKGTSKKKEK